MQIIPVIDIKNGLAVLARQGHRNHYAPLQTPLCASSQIGDVINAYLTIWPFTRFYIADLDALMGTGNNQDIISILLKSHPELHFMIDSGEINAHYLASYPHQYTPTIGTESVNLQTLKTIHQQTYNFILSLDFSKDDQTMGEDILYNTPNLWPKELIIMTLGLVGKNTGPDLIKLKHYCHLYSQHNFIAAGGIRHQQDLQLLKQSGIHQALIASALHYKKINTQHIQNLIRNEGK